MEQIGMNLAEAKKLANANGYFVVGTKDAYLLYRESKPKNLFVAKRAHDVSMVALIKKLCKGT